MWKPRWTVTSKPSNTLPSGTQEIAGSTAPTMCSAAGTLKSARCASRNGAERRPPSRKHWSAAEHSRKLNDSGFGIEGRISVLFRGRGMKRCRAKGRERFEMLVGAAVLANNLMRIAQLLEEQKPKRRRSAG